MIYASYGSFQKGKQTTAQQILQINFSYIAAVDQLAQSFATVAQPVADTPGLRWKIWLMNEAANEAGGIYLFDNQAAVHSYLNGPIITALKEHQALSNFSVKTFDVLEGFTTITRGPVQTDVPA